MTGSHDFDIRAGHAAAAARLALEGHGLAEEADSDSLRHALTGLDSALLPARQGSPTVAVVGRTRAGKSTLRFVLTGQGEDGIGRGGQRTTTEIIDYGWEDVALRDTPGVGAKDGAVDTALAASAAVVADLVMWVVTSDGLQQETVNPVRQMIGRGVPLLVVVNHKEQHELRAGRSWDREGLLTDREARDRRVSAVTADVVSAPPEIVHVQLDVARWARKRDDRSDAWVASGLPELEETLRRVAWRAGESREATRRSHVAAALSVVESSVIGALDNAGAQLLERETELAGQAETTATLRQTWAATMASAVSASTARVQSELDAGVRIASETEHRGKATQAWSQSISTIDAELTSALLAATEQALAVADPNHIPGSCVLGGEPFVPPEVSLEGDPLNARGSRTALNLLKIGVAVPFLVLGPVGAAIGAIAAPSITHLVTKDLGPTDAGELQRRVASLSTARESASQALQERTASLRAEADEVFEDRVGQPSRDAARVLEQALTELRHQRLALLHALTLVREALDVD